jgi:PKD repeat protein
MSIVLLVAICSLSLPTFAQAAPTATVYLDGYHEGAYTSNPEIEVAIGYEDPFYFPYPATYACWWEDGEPECGEILPYVEACSVPNKEFVLNTYFLCTLTEPVKKPDGLWHFCAKEYNKNKEFSEEESCATITVDRAPPVEEVSADHTTVVVGQLVSFTAHSTDSLSGVDEGGYSFNFGDGTAANGGSTAHTFTRPGTYQVTLTGKDNAGNTGTTSLNITVNPTPAIAGPPSPQPPVDTDHDGIPDSQDRCPGEFAKASISEPGDGRAGCLEPLKHHLNVKFGETRKGATLRAYSLVAPVGSQVTLRCRGRACPRSLPRLTTKTPTTSLVSLFRRGGLRRGKALWIPVGTTITVTVAPPNPPGGALGWRISFSPRRHGDPREPETCVSPSGATVKCPG